MSGQLDASTFVTPLQRQRAFALASLMICGCVLTLPLSATHVPRFESFILIADTAFALLSLVVSALLFGQVVMVRSWALLALACGFLLVSATTLPQLVRVSHGEFIDSSLRFFTDLALPLAVIAYALLRVTPPARGGGISLLIRGVAATAAIAIVILGMDWAGSDAAAGSIDAATNTPLQALAATILALTTSTAILLLWRRRASVLDLWLMVAMTAWLIEVLLEALAQDGMSFAWHVAQLYGVLAAACVAMALLAENARLQARIAGVFDTRERVRGAARAAGDTAIDTLADDINQPLCAITANADAIARLLDRPSPDIGEIRAALADISDDAMRASASLRAAQRLTSREPPSVVDVGQLVDECLVGLRTEMHVHDVTCEVETAPQLPGIRGIRRQLLQLLTNLVTNSLEAMSNGHGGERRLKVRSIRHDHRAVAIWIEDSGVGIRPEDLPRVFEPFFTTKPHRTGLGLAVCRSIAMAHGGHISVTPGAGGGAAFRVVLPAGS